MEILNTCSLPNDTKEACAVETMRYMLEKFSQDKGISFEDAFFMFSTSAVYKVLFDLETQVWKEGPDYLRSLFDRELARKN